MKQENDISIHGRRVFASIPNIFKEKIIEVKPRSNIIDVIGHKEVSYKKWLFNRKKFDVTKCKFSATYIFISNEGDVLYVGKAKDVSDRVAKHINYNSECNLFMDYVHSIALIKDADKHEDFYIKHLRPVFNTAGSNDTAYKIAKSTLISKYPSHKDTVIRQLILRDRMLKGSNTSEISTYTGDADLEMIIDMMAIINA